MSRSDEESVQSGEPHPVDVYVGGRVRMRRLEIGMSQQALGDAIGVTFQQMQKYERGANRISASRLWAMSVTLGAPVSYFFLGLDAEKPGPDAAPANEETASLLKLLSDRMGFELARAFLAIPSGPVRHALVELMRTLAKAG